MRQNGHFGESTYVDVPACSQALRSSKCDGDSRLPERKCLLERLAVVRTGAHVGPHVLVEHPHGRHLHVMLAFGALGCALAACLGGASLLLRKHLDIERLARDEG